MNIQDVIDRLNELKDTHGNVEVYVNGEYGSNNCIKAETNMITAGPASLEVDEDAAERLDNEDEVIAHIGGF